MSTEPTPFKPGPYSCVARAAGDWKAHEEEMAHLGIKVSQPSSRKSKSTVRGIEITTAEQYRYLEKAEWIHCKVSTRPITGLEPPPDGFKFEIPEDEPTERKAFRSLAKCAVREGNCRGPVLGPIARCMLCKCDRVLLQECSIHAVAVCLRCVSGSDSSKDALGSAKVFLGIYDTHPKPAPERAAVEWPGSSIPVGFDFDMHIDFLATAPAPSPSSTI